MFVCDWLFQSAWQAVCPCTWPLECGRGQCGRLALPSSPPWSTTTNPPVVGDRTTTTIKVMPIYGNLQTFSGNYSFHKDFSTSKLKNVLEYWNQRFVIKVLEFFAHWFVLKGHTAPWCFPQGSGYPKGSINQTKLWFQHLYNCLNDLEVCINSILD